MDARSGIPPFIAVLIGDNGCKVLLGLGEAVGFVQFSSVDGPPYLLAVDPDIRRVKGESVFLIGGTPTPVSIRFCLRCETVMEIAMFFVQTGQPKPDVRWEAI